MSDEKEKTKKTEEKKWLIKNNNYILGPFTESEVKVELTKDYISPFAMACLPGQEFWGFIAVYPEFVHYADSTKLTQFTKSLRTDITQTHRLGIQTEPFHLQGGAKDSGSTLSPEAQAFLHQEMDIQTDEINTIQKYKKKINLFIIACSIVICSILVFIMLNKPSTLDENNAASLHLLGRAYFDSGNYLKAKKVWEEERNKGGNLSEANTLLFQILKFQLNNDFSQAETIMSTDESAGVNMESKQMIQALIELKTDNALSAERLLNELIETSQSKKLKKAAFANLALLSARNAAKNENCDFFNKYIESEFGNRNLVYFAHSFCLLQSQSVSVDQRTKAERYLKEITQAPDYQEAPYYQEALLGLVYIKYMKGEKVLPLITTLLDSNPYLTQSYYYDIHIDRGIYSWPQLFPLCEKIYSIKQDNRFFIIFYAYCLVRSHHYELAQKLIKKATVMNSEDVLTKAVNAYITGFIGMERRFALVLGDALRSNSDMKYMLPYILQARFCEESMDWNCAIKNWRQVLSHRPDSIAVLGNLAYAKYKQGHYEEAQEYVSRAFELNDEAFYSSLLFVEKSLKE